MNDITRLRDYLSLDFVYQDSLIVYFLIVREIRADRNNIEGNIDCLSRKHELNRTQIMHSLEMLVRVKALAVFNIDGVNCYAIHPHGPVITDEMIADAKVKKTAFDRYVKTAHEYLGYEPLSDFEFDVEVAA